ncbi:MAG: 50S ribosomal protein L31e [Nanoarchaeota archaeon]
MAKTQEEKIELEREYVIPLRRKVQKVPRYRRAKKAVKVLKEFLAKNMKVEERDFGKIKIDKFLNQEIWFRGIKNPPAKIKVKAIKKNGIVYAELAEIPEKVKWDIEKEKKKKVEIKKEDKKETGKVEEKKEITKETKEKEEAAVEMGLKEQKLEAHQMKHEAKPKQAKTEEFHRKSLKK